ncbi:hypothetical protein AN959_01955 [Psychrobacillus sp. FJAT-21963]|nr:hypothetical protein AN959_01955 [Psychrobacillus sp. FJAT-21963]
MYYTNNTLITASIYLLVLAILDSIFTDYGIRNKHISEANPLMKLLYDTSIVGIVGFYFIKISLPLLLIYIMTKVQPKRYIQLLLVVALLIYSGVLFQHFFWISMLV